MSQHNLRVSSPQALAGIISSNRAPHEIKSAINELASRGQTDAGARIEIIRLLAGDAKGPALSMVKSAISRHPHDDYMLIGFMHDNRSASFRFEPMLEEPACVPRAALKAELDQKAVRTARFILELGIAEARDIRAEYLGASCGCSSYAKITAEYSTELHALLMHLQRDFGGQITWGPLEMTPWRVYTESEDVEHALHIFPKDAGNPEFKLILSGVSEKAVDEINALLRENGSR